MIAEVKTGIRKEFAEISQIQNAFEKSKVPDVIEKTQQKVDEKEWQSKIAKGLSESKPLSLKLYENEIARAEKQLLSKSLGEKLSGEVIGDEKNLNVEAIFTPEERGRIKLEAAEIARERLEPKELDADHRKISTEASRQAITTFKQLEQAHNVFLFSKDKLKINEAFFKLNHEAAALSRIRREYNHAEKIALLRDDIKIDISDLLRKSSDFKHKNLTEQTAEILQKNLAKIGLGQIAEDSKRVIIISREISEKIEAKPKLQIKNNVSFDFPQL